MREIVKEVSADRVAEGEELSEDQVKTWFYLLLAQMFRRIVTSVEKES